MVKHIVMFQFGADGVLNPALRSEVEALKTGLEELLKSVPSLKSIEVGINDNPEEKFHMALITTFDNYEGLEAYAIHPEHLAVGKQLRAIMTARSCVDYCF